MKSITGILLVIIIGMSAGCKSQQAKDKNSVMPVQNTSIIVENISGEWVLQTIEGKETSVYFQSDRIPEIIFNPTNYTIKGNAGCNGFQGPFTLSKNKLEIGMLKMTRMYCDNMEGERLFIRLISGKSDLEIKNNILTFNQEGKTKLVFKKK